MFLLIHCKLISAKVRGYKDEFTGGKLAQSIGREEKKRNIKRFDHGRFLRDVFRSCPTV